jgi:hypothetical protein
MEPSGPATADDTRSSKMTTASLKAVMAYPPKFLGTFLGTIDAPRRLLARRAL